MTLRLAGLFLMVPAWFVPLATQADDEIVVHIACEKSDGKTALGSGVLISSVGHVLTAGHVGKDAVSCTGRTGLINGPRLPLLTPVLSKNFDGMVLKFDADFPSYATYCDLTADMRGQEIRVLAFHPGSVAAPSESDGIVSSYELDEKGRFETSVRSVGGKSGGPAFLRGTNKLIGIVTGAEYNAKSEKIDLLTPVDKLTDIASLVKAENCGAKVENYSIEDHERILKEREAQIRRDLEQAGRAEKKLLFAQLDAVATDLTDLQTSYKERIIELRVLRLQLDELNEGQATSYRMEAARLALKEGETNLADTIFQEIVRANSPLIERTAAAVFERGNIALDEARFIDALAHYENAARLDGSYEYILAAQELAGRTGDHKKRALFGEDLLEVATRDFGNDSSEYAESLNIQAFNMIALGLDDEAEPLLWKAVIVSEKVNGRNSEMTVAFQKDLDSFLEKKAATSE